MSDNERPKNHPSHSVAFARSNGHDQNGREVLGPARQIGSIWPKANGKEGDAILRFDHIPEEMRTKGGGVLFIRKLDQLREGRAEAVAERDLDRDR